MPHKDPAKRNAYHRSYYKANREVINKRQVGINRERRHVRYAALKELKSGPCVDCGGSYPSYIMDFDHREPADKSAEISSMVKRMVSWPVVLEEICKCDLVCTRCHRLRTYGGDNNYRSRRYKLQMQVLSAIKTSNPCLDCNGHFEACQMDFDHVGEKTSNVSRLVGGPSDILIAEVGECHLVCANCHRERTETGVRPASPDHQNFLKESLRKELETLSLPRDRRTNPFPLPHLLGKKSDRELAKLTGFSVAMVAWHRRKAGIVLRQRKAS